MDFGNAYLFNKKPADMRRVGGLGGRARARNLRLRKAVQTPVNCESVQSHEETVAEAIQRLEEKRLKAYFLLMAGLLTIMIGVSRVYLGVSN